MSAVVHIVWKVEQSKEEEKIETFYFYDRRDTHCMKTVIVRFFFFSYQGTFKFIQVLSR